MPSTHGSQTAARQGKVLGCGIEGPSGPTVGAQTKKQLSFDVALRYPGALYTETLRGSRTVISHYPYIKAPI